MLNKVIFKIFIVIGIPSLLYAGPLGPYSGMVVDGQTGEPVQGASVLIYWEKSIQISETKVQQKEVKLMDTKPGLLDVKLINTENNGKYVIPKAMAAIGEKEYLEATYIVIYQPGYEAYIKTIWHNSPYAKPDPDFKISDNIVKLKRIPLKFDHRKHYDEIEHALRGLDREGPSSEGGTKAQEFLSRAKWEERRYAPDDRSEAMQKCCGDHNLYPQSPNMGTADARVRYEQFINEAKIKLKDKDPWVRVDAVYWLGAVRARETIPLILDLLEDNTDWRSNFVHQECVIAIAKMAEPDFIEIHGGMIRATPGQSRLNGTVLSKSTAHVAKKTQDKIIGGLNEDARKKVIASYLNKVDDPYLRNNIIRTFGQLRAMEAADIVKKAMNDTDEGIRSVAITAISRLSSPPMSGDYASENLLENNADDALKSFVIGLKDPSAEVRRRAVLALAKSGSASAVAPLISALSEPDGSIKSAAIKGLAKFDDTTILPVLAPFLDSKEYQMRKDAREAYWAVANKSSQGEVRVFSNDLERRVLKDEEDPDSGSITVRMVHPAAVGALIETFNKVSIDGKREVLELLRSFEDKRIQDCMRKALDDPSPTVRRAAVFYVNTFFGREIVPRLIEMATNDVDNLRAAALGALAEYSDPLLPDIYLKALRDPSGEVRRQAVMILKDRPDKRAADTLMHFLNDPDENIVSGAILALGVMKIDRAVDPLISILSGSYYEDGRAQIAQIRKAAAEALGLAGNRDALPVLLLTLGKKEFEQTIIKSLGLIGDRRAVPALITYASGADRRFRKDALQALVEIRDPSLLDTWKTYLEGNDPETKYLAVEAIGRIEGDRALNILIDILRFPDQQQRGMAIRSLGNPKNKKAIRPLLQYCGKNTTSSLDVLEALKRYQLPDMQSILSSYLKDEDRDVRRCAIIMLGEIGDEKAIKPLKKVTELKLVIGAYYAIDKIRSRHSLTPEMIKMSGSWSGSGAELSTLIVNLKSPDPRIRREAVIGIKLSRDEKAPDNIIPLLGDKDVLVRWSAVFAFVGKRNPHVLEPLMKIVGDIEENDTIRAAAAAALGSQGDVKAIDVLIRALNEEAAEIELRSEAALSLGNIGGKKAIEALKDALKADDYRLRVPVGHAMGKLKVTTPAK